MGDGGVSESSPTDSIQTFSDWADEMCAYYIVIGGSCEAFWYGDPTKLNWGSHIRAHELRNEQRNQEMWLQGLYNSRAVSAGMGNKEKKTNKQVEYYDKPVDLRPKESITKEAFLEQWKAKKAAWRAR